MRSSRLFMLLFWLQYILLPSAEGGRPGGLEPPDEPPQPQPQPPSPHPGDPSPDPKVPGAISRGKNPYVTPDDEETDIEEVGEVLKEAISKVLEALLDNVTSTSTDGSGSLFTTIILPSQITPGLSTFVNDCTAAQSAYNICSAAQTSGSSFSALPRTQQAGCLCNAYNSNDFNGDMKKCYNLAQSPQYSVQNATLLQSYASVMANATSLCAPDPCATAGDSNVLNQFANQEQCTLGGPSLITVPSATTTAPTSGAITTAPTSGAITTAPTSGTPTTAPTSGALKNWEIRRGCLLLLVALWAAVLGMEV